MGTGNGINDVQCANTISDRQRTDTPATGVSIGCKGSSVLPGRSNMLERALGQFPVEAQDIMTGNTENVVNTGFV